MARVCFKKKDRRSKSKKEIYVERKKGWPKKKVGGYNWELYDVGGWKKRGYGKSSSVKFEYWVADPNSLEIYNIRKLDLQILYYHGFIILWFKDLNFLNISNFRNTSRRLSFFIFGIFRVICSLI